MSTNPFINTTSGLSPNAGVIGTPGAITANSSTSATVGVGVFSFQVPPQAAWAPGMFVSVVNSANSADYMSGTVVSYSGTTLNLNISASGGSGTFSSWLINLSGVNGGAPGPTGPTGAAGANGTNAGPINGAVQGLKVTNDSGTPSTKIDITAVAATMVNTSGTSVRSLAVSIVIDLTTGTSTSAANGMDGEARGTSAWLYCYLISNGTTTSGLVTKTSPLSGNPTLPAGYTYYTYVGAMYVDSSGNLLRTLQEKNYTHYVVTASTNTASLPAMANGSAGSVSVPTWVGIALGAFVPPTASSVYVSANGDVGGTGVAIIVAPNNAYGNATSTNPPPVAVGTGSILSISEMPIESSNIYWASAGTDGYLFCIGWDDCVATA